MATRTISSSSSGTEGSSSRVRGISETSGDTISQQHRRSPSEAINQPSIAESNTVRSASPTASQASASVTRTAYEGTSVTSVSNVVGNNSSNLSQLQQVAGGIPIIRPPVLQQTGGSGVGAFGPQHPAGYTGQPSMGSLPIAPNPTAIRVDVAAAHQQYQQAGAPREMSSFTGSTASSSGASLSSPGSASLNHQQFDHSQRTAVNQQGTFNQTTVNQGTTVTREETRQWNQAGAQRAQFPNQIPAHQVYNELLGPDAFKDVILDIDYGALGDINVAFQQMGDLSGGQLPPGISVRPAYTTMDSLNYQQHMFNTGRTIYADGGNQNYDYGAGSSNYNIGGGQHFDVAKAIFNQVDVNHDGSITRDEFQQWAQGGQQNYGAQGYSANYGSTVHAGGNNHYNTTVLDGGNPDVASILQQSGLGQVLPR